MAKDAKRWGWRNVDGGGEVGASKEGRSIVVVRGGDRNSRHWNLAEEEIMDAENVGDIIVNMNK